MEKTKVVFRRWKGFPRTVIALFPELPAVLSGLYCESYQHLGQHGGADYNGVISRTEPVSESDDEVRELMRELEGIGYELDVRQRATPAMRRALWDGVQRLKLEEVVDARTNDTAGD